LLTPHEETTGLLVLLPDVPGRLGRSFPDPECLQADAWEVVLLLLCPNLKKLQIEIIPTTFSSHKTIKRTITYLPDQS
jgi:hypothetical protein